MDGTFEKSETIGKIASALAKAQGQFSHAVKDSVNPHFKSNYADLASVIDAIRQPLADAGIARHQAALSSGDAIGIRTTLIHAESSEYLASTVWVTLPADKRNPQGLGSALTYLRRYSLAAAVGIAQEDDDAEGATRGKPATPAKVIDSTGKDRAAATGAIVSPPTGVSKDSSNASANVEKAKEIFGLPTDADKDRVDRCRDLVKALDWAKPHLQNHIKKHYPYNTAGLVSALKPEDCAAFEAFLKAELTSKNDSNKE